jgi:hypothetical protein
VNDFYTVASTSSMTTKITDWLVDMRSALGPRPAIFMVVPFDFGNTSNAPEQVYKTAWLAGVTNYTSAHPSDTRVFIDDLGANGYNIVQAHSNDSAPKVHPDDTGAALLGAQVFADTASEISTVLNAGVISSAAAATSTTTSLATTAPTGGIAPYSYKWYRSTTSGFTPDPSTLITGTSDTLDDTGLNPSTTYYYKVVYGDSTNPDQSITSSQFSVTTDAAPPVTNSGGGTSSGGTIDAVTPVASTVATTTTSSDSTKTTTDTSDASSVPTTISVGTIDNTTYSSGSTIKTSAHPTINGVAPPYAQVTVTFHSTPTECETNADANGNWSCTLNQALPAGTHKVDITAVTSDGQTITYPEFNIQVASSVNPATTSQAIATVKPVTKSYTWVYWLIGLVILIALIIPIIKKNRKVA